MFPDVVDAAGGAILGLVDNIAEAARVPGGLALGRVVLDLNHVLETL